MDIHPFSFEQLIAFASGELSQDLAAQVAEHLTDCRQCSAVVRHYQSVRDIVREDDTVAPPAETLARATALFSYRKPEQERLWLRFFRATRSLAMAPVIAIVVFALVLLAASGTVLASAARDALPGDQLYPIKTTMEDVNVALSPDSTSRVQAQLAAAQSRVSEIQTLTAKGRYDLVAAPIQNYEEHIQGATAALAGVPKQDPSTKVALAQKVQENITLDTSSLEKVQKAGPTEVEPVIEHAVQVSVQAKTAVQRQLATPVAPTSAALPSATNTSLSTSTIVPATATVVQPAATASATLTTTPAPTGTSTSIAMTPPTPTNPPRPRATSTITPSPTATSKPLPVVTSTPLPTATSTLTPTATYTPSPTATDTPSPTVTNTLSPTATYTPSPTATSTILPPTSTPLPPTSTPVPPTQTPVPPTSTAAPPAGPPLPPTSTPPLAPTSPPQQAPTNLPLPPAPPTGVPVASTSTPAPPPLAATPPPATSTSLPPPASSPSSQVSPSQTGTPAPLPTNTSSAPTNTPTLHSPITAKQ